jgi:hypothetical protein
MEKIWILLRSFALVRERPSSSGWANGWEIPEKEREVAPAVVVHSRRLAPLPESLLGYGIRVNRFRKPTSPR